MKHFLILVSLLFVPIFLSAQITGPITSEFNSIRQNGVSTIVASGDTVWISPSLNRNIENAPEWDRLDGLDFIDEGKARVFSIDVNGDSVVAGLGFTSETLAGNQPAGFGYYISTDGGDTWRFSDFLLDVDPPANCNPSSSEYENPSSPGDYDPDCDIQFTYGGRTYNRIRITVPQQSPPYNVAFKGNVIFSANWASGLLRSTNLGESWERVILPPFNSPGLNPDQEYSWASSFSYVGNDGSSESVIINRYDPVADDNLKGFALHIDSQNRVWFGSAGGINVSENALTAPLDSIRWKNVNFDNSSNGLLARWIIEIQEDPSNGRIWMTNWLAESTGSAFQGLDQFGIVYTDDGGESFKQRLIGQKILGITFKDGYVFAAGENGLFISKDGGDTWTKSPQIKSANTFLKTTAEFQAATASTDRVWISTSDGIISTGDLGKTWEITRVNFPLSGGNTYDEDAASVDSYAYPNPFSPIQHEIVRIRFKSSSAGAIKVRIFDFGMNLVRELDQIEATSGEYEAIWNGIDQHGRKVANGPYFYVIEAANETIKGKLLLIE